MVRRYLDRRAPRNVSATREVESVDVPAYREAPIRRETLLIRIHEAPASEGASCATLLAALLIVVGMAGSLLSGATDAAIITMLALFAVLLWKMLHHHEHRAQNVGYRGVLRLESGWLRSESASHGIDVTADLALVDTVEVVTTEGGIDLLAQMRDGERVRLATAILEVEVARWVAARIVEASNKAEPAPPSHREGDRGGESAAHSRTVS